MENENKLLGYFGFNVAELSVIKLKPGDVLTVTVRNDDLDESLLNTLRLQLSQVFTNNKVFIFGLGVDGDVKFSIVEQEDVGYCSNCNCGKKEQTVKEEE